MTDPQPSDAPLGDVESLSYASALGELESILAQLEDDSLDVDGLADRVGRAAALIRLCRRRIADTRMEVERIVADLDGTEPAPPPEGP